MFREFWLKWYIYMIVLEVIRRERKRKHPFDSIWCVWVKWMIAIQWPLGAVWHMKQYKDWRVSSPTWIHKQNSNRNDHAVWLPHGYTYYIFVLQCVKQKPYSLNKRLFTLYIIDYASFQSANSCGIDLFILTYDHIWDKALTSSFPTSIHYN